MGTERTYGYNLPHSALEACLTSAAEGGLKWLEVNIPKGEAPHVIFPPERIMSIRTEAQKSGATISFHIPFKADVSDIIPPIRNANIKYLLGCLETAAEMGVPLLTIHLGNFYWFPVEQRTRRKALDRFVSHIASVLETCAANHIRLAMENVVPLPQWSEYRHLGDSIADFEYILSRVDSEYLGVCLDTGHAHVGNGVTEYINALGPHIFNVHIHDNPGNDDNHLLVGEGTIDWALAVQAFLVAGFQGPFVSECRNENPAEAARRLERYFYSASPVKS